ncbi:MAG: VWA domain-containing protein [Chloroflexi bacterium]|nr:VWA domain-containing protein [Chloroflexota bacterium]
MVKRIRSLARRQYALAMLVGCILLAGGFAPTELTPRQAAKHKPDYPGEAVAFRLLQLQDANGFIPSDGLSKAAQHLKAMQGAQREDKPSPANLVRDGWAWLGPGNIGGRVRSILVHPSTPATMWLGSVSGGIWKTTDGGASWQPLDNFMANLAVSTLAMHPTNPDIIYAGTGEGFFNFDAIQGAGIFRTADGGNTWTQLPSTANLDFYYVNRLAVDPTDGRIILAATNNGIFRTTNEGATWTRETNVRALDLKFHPTNSSLAVAGGSSGNAWYSTDGGATWTTASGNPSWTGAGRVELAYARSNPSIVYASVNRITRTDSWGNQLGGEVYRSADGGRSYARVNTGTEYLASQGWYDDAIWVDPTDADILVVGGVDLWRSTNGGSTLTRISEWWRAPSSAHADHHAIVAHPSFDGNTNKTVFFGNDGGIYKAADVYTVQTASGWQELNNNLGITQFYGAAGNPTSGVIVGGTQDNGTLRYTGGVENWSTMYGGDGGFSAADPTDSKYFYGEYVFLTIHRSSNGGASSSPIYTGIADAGSASAANFIAPFIIDPNDSNTLLAGGRSLWRSANVKAATPAWASIKSSVGSNISAIAVAPGNSGIIWVGHNNGNIYKTANGKSSNPTWTRVDTNTPNLPDRFVTRLAIDRNDPSVVYATFGGFSPDNVWRTRDGGATWTSVVGSGITGLPQVPVRSLVIHPKNSNLLYAGTEVGVFASKDSGATWTVPQSGPANVSVDELFWLNDRLVAATHGRGLYSSPAFTVISPLPTSPVQAGRYNSPNKVVVRVTKPWSGLAKDDFAISIGGRSASIVTLYEGSEEYVLEVTPPPQSANGMYGLSVSASPGTEWVSDDQSDAVIYSAVNNVDVALVIDRSGSMDDYGKMSAAKNAAKQFVDLMQTGDMVGVVSFDDQVETNYPLTAIPSSAVTPVFSDDMEAGAGNWTVDAPWALTTESSYSPSHAWTDSPGRSYDNNANVSLQMASPINVPAFIASPVLSYWQRYDTEACCDRGYVEVSTNGGGSWTSLTYLSGTNLSWHNVELDLASYKGRDVLVRFRLSTDYSVTGDGWYIDDVSVGPSTANVRVSARNAIDLLSSWGGTSIGGGLQRGQEQLTSRGNAGEPWAIVLLSDGLENTAPYVVDVLPAIKGTKTIVHTVGLGADADEATLRDIASQTGGTYNFAPTPQQLAGIYDSISGMVANRQTLLASTGVAQQGVTDQKNVVVDTTVSEAIFSLSWSNSGSIIDLKLRKPDGSLIDSTNAVSDPNVEYVAGSTYRYYRVKTPTLASGTWRLLITGGSVSALQDKGTIAPAAGEPYVARVTAQGGLTLRLILDRDSYVAREQVKLIATLSDSQPIWGAAVSVSVQRLSQASQALRSTEWIEFNGDKVPDLTQAAQLSTAYLQAASSLTLYDDGLHGDGGPNDGTYANTYGDTSAVGTYVFTASASGTANAGGAFARQAELSTYIAPNPEPVRIFLPVIARFYGGQAFNWLDATSGAVVAQGDDVYQYVNLPFSFRFFGGTYTGLYVSSNGYVSFGAGYSNYGNSCIPSASAPNNAIYAFWDDLEPAGGGYGNIYVSQVDNDTFVIEWYRVKKFGASDYETFEIVLRRDNTILLQYQSVSNTGSATVGTENAAGTIAQQYLCNGAGTPLGNQLAIGYTAP